MNTGLQFRVWTALLTVLFLWGSAFALPAGLVHHWNFDEGPDWHADPFQTVCQATVAHDSVSTADLTLQNMDSSDWVSGVQFTCVEFDGSNEYLSTSTNLTGVLGDTASLAYWVRTTAVSVPGITGSDDIQWGSINASGQVVLTVGGSASVTSTDAINDGVWHHVAITRNATTGAAQVYIDGVLSVSGTGGTGVKTTAFYDIARIGTEYFQGRLDQIHVFDAVIDATMVTTLMDNHAPTTWESTNQGTNAAAFTTNSIFFNSYDPEQDTLSVVSYTQGNNGAVNYNGDGSFSYTADTGFVGIDSFEVVIEDGNGGFRRSNVRVAVIDDPGTMDDKRTVTFTDFQAIQAGGSDITLDGMRCPRAIDWEGDGDKDLLIGYSGAVWRYTNTGSSSSAVFSAGVRVQAAAADISLSGIALIAFADMTGDGVDDLVAVDNSNKIHIYENTSDANEVPVYSATVVAKQTNNSDFVLPDPRFDVGDWDGDDLPDIIMGRYSGEVRVYLNQGTASDPRYDSDAYEFLNSDLYNIYPRLFDIGRNGVKDLVQGINWGYITYAFDPLLKGPLAGRAYTGQAIGSLVSNGTLTITDPTGSAPNLQTLTGGAIVDFADYNGDDVYDLVIGGHADPNVYIAYGVAKTVADCIADVESIYDANPSNLGTALEANDQALLNVVNNSNETIVMHMQASAITELPQMFADLAAHVGSYSFLQMDSILNTSNYHHVPSIAGQNLMTLHQMLPDTLTHRTNVADTVGLVGTARDIYIRSGLHVGDNQRGTAGQLESILECMTYLPREMFPDAMVTLDHYYGDGRGGTANAFAGGKNTFNWGQGQDVQINFGSDVVGPIEDILGAGSANGDYFTFVLGHEATHSLDWYVRRCLNEDLERRWGQMLVLAGGPDIVAGSNGWIDGGIDWTATKAYFQSESYWDGVEANWQDDWEAYWSSGPGSAWVNLSFMRGTIDWFLENTQETLATQANQHYSNSEGRLIGAIDRWRRGVESGIEPMKANITECTTFIDFVSAGLNKVVMYDTRGIPSPYPHADYTIYPAWLQRSDKGYITKINMNDHIYDFVNDANGIVTGVSTNIIIATDDTAVAYPVQFAVIDVLANDYKLEGGVLTIESFTQPAHGEVSDNGDGKLRYLPDAGYTGLDSFTYTATDTYGQGQDTATVTIAVTDELLVTPTVATVSSENPGVIDRDADHTVDSSGLTGDGFAGSTHTQGDESVTWTTVGWIGPGTDFDPYITYDMGGIGDVTTMRIWNFNAATLVGSPLTKSTILGPDEVDVYTSVNGVDFTFIETVYFAEAPGTDGYTGQEITVDYQDVRFIKFDIMTNHDGAVFDGTGTNHGVIDGRSLTGLSEVRFVAKLSGKIATDDTAVAYPERYTVIDVLANDYRLGGGTPILVGFTQAAHGVVSDNGDGRLCYLADASYSGQDSFTYTVADAYGPAQTTATVSITVIDEFLITPMVGDYSSYIDYDDRHADHTVDSSGLTGDGSTGSTHAVGESAIVWTTAGSFTELGGPDYAPYITYDLGDVYNVSKMRIWNYNSAFQTGSPPTNITIIGPDEVDIYTSVNGIDFTFAETVYFDEASALSSYTGQDIAVDYQDVCYIKFDIMTNHDGAVFDGTGTNHGVLDGRSLTGLSEVRFEAKVDMYSGSNGIYDLVGFTGHWLDSRCVGLPPCGGADLDGDWDVDLLDFTVFASNWLSGI